MLQVPSKPGHLVWTDDKFTPTLGQVTFILSKAPIDPSSLRFFVNGVRSDDPSDYTVSGVTVTWLDTLYIMDPTDLVVISYQ
jgi:hypothetical protein